MLRSLVAACSVRQSLAEHSIMKQRAVDTVFVLSNVSERNACAGDTTGYVGYKTFDQMAGELKA